MDEKWPVKFSQTIRLPRNCWFLLHAAKLRHGTDGFTSPPKEGMLRIFSSEKSDGFGRDRTREASMLTTRPPKSLSTHVSNRMKKHLISKLRTFIWNIERTNWMKKNEILAFEILHSVCSCHHRNPDKCPEDALRYRTANGKKLHLLMAIHYRICYDMKRAEFSNTLFTVYSSFIWQCNTRMQWRSQIATHHVTRNNTPIHNILSTAPQLSISQKALGTLPEDGNVMPKHVGVAIHN
jgi:hypothetical protein